MILTYTSNRFVLSSFSYRSVQILTDLKSVNIGSVRLCVIVIKKNECMYAYMCMSVADVYAFECIENGSSLFCGSNFYELCQMGKNERRKKTTLNVKIVCLFCLCHTTAT